MRLSLPSISAFFLPRLTKLTALLAGLAAMEAASAVFGAEAPLVSDPVEPNDGWETITKGTFSNAATTGLSPAAGENFFNGRNTADAKAPDTNRGLAKFFPGVKVTPGTYVLQFSVARLPGLPLPGNIAVQLLADANGDGKYSWNERLADVATDADRPAPGENAWAAWTIKISVPPGVKTSGGQPAAGKPLGVMVLSNTKLNSAFAFDALTIERGAE